MKTAFFGGSFDPIHYAHMEIINELNTRFDKVFVMVSNNWTKSNSKYSFEQRNSALKEISKKFKNVYVLDWEAKEDTTSTYLVVKKIQKEFNTNPYIAIGSDNCKNIDRWKSWDLLKKECQFVIFTRDEIEINPIIENSIVVKFKSKYFGLSSSKIKKESLIEMIPKEVQHIFKDSL